MVSDLTARSSVYPSEAMLVSAAMARRDGIHSLSQRLEVEAGRFL